MARLEKEIEKAKKADLPSVFLGGSCEDNNDWRRGLKKEFEDKLYFIDPYDPNWDPEENIYDELAAIINADYTVFYKGGDGTRREQWFMDQADREYADFNDLDKLRAYLERLVEPVKRACISEPLKRLAGDVDPFGHMKMFKVLPKGWPANHWVPICESCMEGKHISYGIHHMPADPKKEEEEGNLARYGCKNIGEIDGKRYQCNCNAASSEILDAIKEHKIRTADYPNHPNDMVLPKSDWNSREVLEIDVWNYYSAAKAKMVSEFKGRNLFIGVVPKDYKKGQKPIYIRHPYHGNTEYIRIRSDKEFEIYHSGRTVEYHVTMPQYAPYYIIDIDAPGKFSDTKKITAEVADALGNIPEVKDVEIRYSGKRGFHTLGWLKKAKDVNDARSFLHDWLKTTFADREDVVLGESPQGDKPALGLSPMKVNGGQVALWSLRVSGLCCIEVPRAQLMSFEREDASIEKTLKKLSGKTSSLKRSPITYSLRSLVTIKSREDHEKQIQIEELEKENKKIPKTQIEELPGTPIEKPMAKAVKALINEKTRSSGYHFGFERSKRGIDPCWAIIFDGEISNAVKSAAEKSGLKINHVAEPFLTDVYLPNVEKDDLERQRKHLISLLMNIKPFQKKHPLLFSSTLMEKAPLSIP